MTNPDWRPIETVTPEMYAEGDWYWGGASVSPKETGFNIFRDFYPSCQVYGPIPDPPKPPPKLRRFEATHKGVRVSGTIIKGREPVPHTYRTDENGVPVLHCTTRRISEYENITWLDPE